MGTMVGGIPSFVLDEKLKMVKAVDLKNENSEKGNLFQMYHKFELPTATSAYISFNTPADKDVRVFPTVLSTSADKLTFKYFEGATVSGGAAIIPRNQNRQSDEISSVLVSVGPTVTDEGTQIAQVFLGGGTGVGQTRSGTAGGGGDNFWKLKRDTTYLLKLENSSTETNILNINEIWIEGE